MRARDRVIARFFRKAIVTTLAITAWFVLAQSSWVNPMFLPQPADAATALGRMLTDLDTYVAALATLYRALVGLLLALAVSVPLGLLLGRSTRLYELVEFPIDFFRSIPSSALFFLFVLFFGIGDASKIAVVFYGCSLVVLINTIYGARPTKEKQQRISMVRSFGGQPWHVFWLAVFPDAVPHIMAGTRVCVSLALVLVIVTEMFLGTTIGLGRRVYDLYLAYRIADMYAALILLGLLGYAANQVFVILERRLCFWSERSS